MKSISFLWLSPTLTAIGKRFEIDAHFFAKNSLFVVIGYFISMIRGFIAGYLIVRMFEQDMYGEYQFILTVTSMISFVGLAGLSNPVARAWARNEHFSLDAITKLQIKISAIGSMFLISSIPFLHYFHREEFWLLFLAAALLLPLPSVAIVRFAGFTIGKARFDISLRASLVWSTLLIIAALAILFLYQSALLMFIAVTSIPSLVYLYYAKDIKPPPQEGRDMTKDIIRYGWQLTFATLPVDMVWYLDKMLISYFFGLNQLAAFSVALLIPEQVKSFSKQFLPLSFAKQAAGIDTKERRRKLIKVVFVGTALFALGISAYIAVCPFIIPILFPKYDAVQITLLTTIAALSLVTMPGSLFSQYLEARGLIREIRISNWSATAIFAASLCILIPWYGLIGALVARGIFRSILWSMSLWFVMKVPVRE